MDVAAFGFKVCRLFSRSVTGLGLVCVAVLAGCPSTPPPDGGDGEPGGTSPGTGTVTAAIVSPTTSFGLSLGDLPVTVRYTVTGAPDDIQGFYVPVADATPLSAPIGDRVIIATDLPAGTNQFFNFNVDAVGFYRVGVVASVGSRQEVAESQAVIQVEGPPSPRFILPVEAVTEINAGADILIRFDAADPENNVRWRLFYLRETDLRNVSPAELGTQLAFGSGNIGSFTWGTGQLEPGDYELGVSATDSGVSVATTVARGELDRIVTIPNGGGSGPIVRIVEERQPLVPTLNFLAPGSADVDLFRNEGFTVRVEARVREPGASGFIEIFYDDDRDANNGFVTLTTDTIAPESQKTLVIALPTDLPEGTYNIGAKIIDGVNNPVTRYADGRISVVRTVTLEVTDPNSTLPVAPGDPVQVRWTTSVPESVGTVDVFAQTMDPESGEPFGNEIPILTDAPVTTTSATFVSSASGLFEISVRLTVIDGTILQQAAPAPVRISTLPRILWLGSLAQSNPAFEGALFGGVNIEDNAGTSFTTAGDLNGDGNDEFVIAARYGKPFFRNPNGIGWGEAYIIYGRGGEAKLRGTFNLNSVGTPGLKGVILTGIRTAGDSDDTDGLADVTLIPDADRDGKSELAFGFPRTDSAGMTVGVLESPGQFLNGGVVILSSNNNILSDPFSGVPVISLDEVGQSFSDMTIVPSDNPNAFNDQLRFEPETDGCVDGTDSVVDTIIGPSVGFISILAPPRWEQLGLVFVSSSEAEAEGRCRTQVEPNVVCTGRSDLNPEEDAGSGFYLAEAIAREPRGARIIGPSEGDGFGTSITWSNALGDDSPGDLIISAPNRSASPSFVDGINGNIANAGIAFMANNRNLWGSDNFFLDGRTPPTPHQYLMGLAGHCGDGRASSLDAIRIAGNINDNIQVILGIHDFNGDGRNDIAVGAPKAEGGRGRVYIAYRREEAIEGDFVLNKLERGPSDPERLTGMLIGSNSLDALGTSLATDVDLNGDGIPDLVIGSPDASAGVGEVIVVFGRSGVVTPAGGLKVSTLLNDMRAGDGGPVAVRITGNALDASGGFGFNIANAGDVDGDGTNDLLIAAPGASPRFDPDPNDGVDELTKLGVDMNLDGIQDGIPGEDDLSQAGIVYVILGSNRFDLITTCTQSGKPCASDAECDAGEVCDPDDDMTISIDQLGTAQLQGFMIAGRRAGDRIGGGDAGDQGQGGISSKAGRGRSFGLASAGDVDGDGRADILIGSILADPKGRVNAGEAYLIYGTASP